MLGKLMMTQATIRSPSTETMYLFKRHKVGKTR